MRRQELIYNQVGGGRNRISNILNSSSDICIFKSPIFDMVGADKIVSGFTSTSDGIHLIESKDELINFTFDFIDNISSFSNTTNFSFGVYKFDETSNVFSNNEKITSEVFNYINFNTSNKIETSIKVSDLDLDGEYLIKGRFEHDVCTGILKKLGSRNTTTSLLNGAPYNSYNDMYDFYFSTSYSAREPLFDISPNSDRVLGALNSTTFFPNGERTFILEQTFSGTLIVTLNGLVLSLDEDYTIDKNIVTLSGPTVSEDILTFTYVGASSSNGLVSRSYTILRPILNGATDKQGNEIFFFNTTTGKYEIFLEVNPVNGNDIMLSLNGAVLANGVDYYQSISNTRRIILEGEIILGDIVTLIYNSNTTYVGSVTKSDPAVHWKIDVAPNKVNGKFTVQLSTDKFFSNVVFSVEVPYVVNQMIYSANLSISGGLGDKFFYRVVNDKEYVNITKDIIYSTSTSEIIPITINTNSLNKY